MPEGLRAALVGEMEGAREGENCFRFGDVFPGEHTLYVYGERGTVEISEFVTDMASARIELEYMIDLCIGTELTPVRGIVTDASGKPVSDVVVAVPGLFVETVTDKDGGYELRLPPGEWMLIAAGGGETAEKPITLERPAADFDVPAVKLDLRLE